MFYYQKAFSFFTRSFIYAGSIPLLLGLSTLPDAQANLLVYDGFAYDEGAVLNGQNGGMGFTSAWSESGPVSGFDFTQAGSLPRSASFTNLLTSGNSARLRLDSAAMNFTSSIKRSFTTIPGVTGTTVWASFLVRKESPTSTNPPIFAFELYSDVVNSFPIRIGDSSSTRNVFALSDQSFDGVTAESSFTIVPDQTAFLVVRIEFREAAELISLYVNPQPGDTAPATASATKGDFALPNLASLSFYGESTVGRQWSFDEVRIGTTYGAVAAPEPTSVGLLLVGALITSARRARRSHPV